MRTVSSVLFSLAVVPGLLALPTVGAPPAEPRAVAPNIQTVALQGVDAQALKAEGQRSGEALEAGRRAVVATTLAAAAQPEVEPAVLSGQLETQDFDAVGVTWKGAAPAGMQVAVRVREAGGWSAWEPLPLMDDGPDEGTAEAAAARSGSTPLLTDGADGVQVRVDAPDGQAPQDLRVDLIDPGTSKADSQPAQPAATAAAAPLNVITRAQWGADESLRRGSSTVMSGVKAMAINHTATTNAYSEAGAFQQLRSIYAYHTRTLGWNDIGYNLLVDRFGRVFEGRAGSLTQAVQGAHASGFNSYTQGISVLGQFQPNAAGFPAFTPVSQAAVNAVGDVAGWLSARFRINPQGTTQLTSAGGGTARYARGTTVTLPTIFGHRNTSYTACPGDSLYSQMATIRARAAASAPALAPAPAPVGLSHPALNSTVFRYGPGVVSFTATVPSTQRFTVTATSVCSAVPARSWSGVSSGDKLSWAWNLLDGVRYQPVPPGVYRLSMVTTASSGQSRTWSADIEVLGGPGAPPAACGVTRLGGADRYATSVQTGQRAFPRSTAVILASGADAALVDGLVAGPFARTKSAPLLLTQPSSLPAAVVDDIKRRGTRTAWLVGSTGVISRSVESQLRSLGVSDVRRLAGPDRYATAAAVAQAMGSPSGQALVASGLSIVDAAGAAGAAAGAKLPILLTDTWRLPAPTAAALKALGARSVKVVGSTAVVSDTVLSGLRGAGASGITRLGGADRYATAAAVAAAFDDVLGATRVAVTSGANASVVDAMSASSLGHVTLLTAPTTTPPATQAYLRQVRPVEIYLTGSTGAVSTRVAAELSGMTR